MWSRLAIALSLATVGLASAETTVLGCLSADAASASTLFTGKAETSDECATYCLGENAWFSAFESSTSSCKCSHTIPSSMVRGSKGCEGAESVVSVIRPALLSSMAKPTQSRRKVVTNKSRQGSSDALCEPGLMACNVADLSGYECTDVSSDALSCGGCTYGVYGITPATSAPDCSAMPGAERDYVLCVSGSCLATACQKGYQLLEDGTCFWL